MDSEISAGRLIGGRYELDEPIASGGMAQVWKARDQILDRFVAVKILHPHRLDDPVFVERFHTEAVAAARLNHPGIVAIFDTCSAPGVEAIVMELITGMTLREYLDRFGAIDPIDAIDIALHVTEALEAAHAAGVIHRDIKPGNILLCDDRRVKVTDFGIARASGTTDLTKPGHVLGTPKYLAPEQVQSGPVDGRTDVYSLGAGLYECICGKAPFVENTEAATALARLHRDPDRPRHYRAGLSDQVEELLLELLAREPSDRPASATAARLRLQTVRNHTSDDGAAVEPIPEAAEEDRPSFTKSERKFFIPAFGIVAIAVGLITAGLLLGGTETGRDVVRAARDVVAAPEETDVASPEPSEAPADTPAAEPVNATDPVVERAVAFDPAGSGPEGENNAMAAFALDGEANTAWRTEGYNDRNFGNLKPGVGIYLEIDRPTALGELTVSSPTTGWSAEIYVTDQATTVLADWGDPVDAAVGISGVHTFDLRGSEGQLVLLWITDLGEGAGRVRVEVAELELTLG